MADQVGIALGLGRNARHLLDPVDGAALDQEERRRLGLDLEQDGPRLHQVAVGDRCLDLGVRIDHADGFVGQQNAAHHPGALGVDLPGLNRIVPDQKPARGVAGADLFAEPHLDQRSDHETVELHSFASLGPVAGLLLPMT